MKVISLWQPFAQLIVLGEKQYETRSWCTNHRGKLLIHASLTPYKNVEKDICRDAKIMINRYLSEHGLLPEELIKGAIVGCVEITDCIMMDDEMINMQISPKEYYLGDWAAGRYAWKVENPVMFRKPIMVKGNQGLWNYNIDLEEVMNLGK